MHNILPFKFAFFVSERMKCGQLFHTFCISKEMTGKYFEIKWKLGEITRNSEEIVEIPDQWQLPICSLAQ